MKPQGYCGVYITASNAGEAQHIGRVLVEERLAACVNIIDRMESMYWWQGEVQNERETVMIAKTREDAVEALIERVKEVHSYDCPCVAAFPIVAGNTDFLHWIGEQVDG